MHPEKARLVAKEMQLQHSSEARSLYFHGQSMYPFLVEGDEVVVAPVEWRDIRVGDVVSYRFHDKFPTRRVIRKTREGLHLWCENWPARRFYAPRHDVLGRAVARKRGETWITPGDREWVTARRRALAGYWGRVTRRAVLNVARRSVVKVARLSGLVAIRRWVTHVVTLTTSFVLAA